MRREQDWRPTKFAMTDGQLQADASGAYVSVTSRIIADLLASHYSTALEAHARGRLLDLGCGNVPLFGVYRKLVEEVYCVDWPTSIHGGEHIDVFANLAEPLPFRDASFDTVLLTDVLEHIPTPENLIGEASRLLRAGGNIIIGVPFLYWLHEIPHDYNRYTRYQLERLLRKAGLNILQLTAIGGSPEVLADILGKTFATRPKLAMTFVTVARWLLNRARVRRLSFRTREIFPLAYLVVATK